MIEREVTMGHRANLIICSNHSYELYYSHWCANTLPIDLFWGPEHAVRFIERQTKVDESGWLNDVWAEGGAVIDMDKKKLIFYGGEDLRFDIPLRRLYLGLMKQTWPEWDIDLAYEGIADIAVYVGYSRENVLTERKDEVNEISFTSPENKSWVNVIGSVKFAEDDVLIFPLTGCIEDYLLYGPALLDKIDQSLGHKHISLSEWTEEFPVGGFHIDVSMKRVAFWHANDIPDLSGRLAQKWAGWDVEGMEDNYEGQARSTNHSIQFPEVDYSRLVESLKALLLRESANPLESLSSFVQKTANEGITVEVNPLALQHDRYVLPRSVKEEMVDNAVSKWLNP